MGTKKLTGKPRVRPVPTIMTFIFTLAAVPLFLLASVYAYTLILTDTGASTAFGCTILGTMVIILGFIIFKR